MLISCGLPIKALATECWGRHKAKLAQRKARWGDRLRIIRTAVWTALGLLVAGVAGFGVLAYQPEIAAVSRPAPASFDKALVERGRVLANYGDCTACHTRPDGAPFAGNLPLRTPFGTIYTSNITPDAKTGIGTWSREA